MKSMDERVHDYRAEWSYQKLHLHFRSGERVLNLGAGDCRLDLLLKTRRGCDMVPVDVEDHNETHLPLTLYDGRHLPFADQSFDVVLLLWVLHHSVDPGAVLAEARRVARRTVIIFEDRLEILWDRLVFRGFHRFLRWSQGFLLPNHEFNREQWVSLATQLGLRTVNQETVGYQLGPVASCTIGFHLEPRTLPARTGPNPAIEGWECEPMGKGVQS